MSSYLLDLLLILLFLSSTEQKLLYPICGTSGNFTENSTYGRNLQGFLSSLTSAVSFTGFLTQGFGQIPDLVYTLVICRGDVTLSECSSCVRSASRDALRLCPNNKQTILWYDFCLFHYSNLPFLDSVDNEDPAVMAETQNATDPSLFMKLVYELLNATAHAAVYNTSRRYAVGELNKSATHLYTLAQCIPNLSDMNCSKCLRKLLEPLPDSVYGKIGARVLGPVCSVQYEVYCFYTGAPMVKLTAEVANGRRGKRKNIAVYIAVPLAATAALFVSIIFIICIRKKNEKSDIDDIDCPGSLLLDLSTLQDATANFHEEYKLGEGSFGAVYKGVLPDGQEIAVKRLAENSWQGVRELKNELVLVARLKHKNLVRLLGACLNKEKMIVYEYIPNGSLDTFLQDATRREQLHWETRFRIIHGIARGLLYLHEESRLTVVHRDLKASNILLDANMNPKISDFGLAKLFLGDQTHKSTTRIVGTFGYMPPEYVLHGHFSVKSDVFSFGVLVLEIITGRKSSNFQDTQYSDLLSWIWKNWINGTITEMLEQSALGEDWPRSEVLRCIRIGLLCVEENPNDRPNMSTVVLALSRATVSLQSPSRPAFWIGTRSLLAPKAEPFQRRLQRELVDPARAAASCNELTFSDFEAR